MTEDTSKRPVKYVRHGLSLPVTLFLIFLTLKLAGLVQWSWVWVTLPLWLVPVSVLITMALIGLFFLAVSIFIRK